MRFIFAAALICAAIPASAEPLRSYADCIKALDQAVAIVAASESISRSTMQSVTGQTVTDKDGTEIDLVKVNGDLVRANKSLIDALASACEKMR